MKIISILGAIAAAIILAFTFSTAIAGGSSAQASPGIILAQAAPAPVAQSAPPTTPQPPPEPLSWDSDKKEVTAKAGEAEAYFTFSLTNVSHDVVTILNTQTSCGCTVAQLPSQPWNLGPGSNGQINVTMHLAGKPVGANTKQVYVNFPNRAAKTLTVTTTILPPPPTPPADK